MAGRGGAGNIEAANRRISRDFEASQDAAETQQDPSPIEQALRSEQKERKVAYSGRGGAGNMYDPSELSEKGRYSHWKAKEEAVDDDVAIRMRGRGGAGNFVSDSEVIEGREAEPLSGKEQIGRPEYMSQVEREVEEGLARPDAAYLGPKEKERDTRLSGGV